MHNDLDGRDLLPEDAPKKQMKRKKNIAAMSMFFCSLIIFVFSHSLIYAKECNHLLCKPKYRIIYDNIYPDNDIRVVVLLEKHTKRYCAYVFDHCALYGEKITLIDVFRCGKPISYEEAQIFVDLEELGINIYGFEKREIFECIEY